MQPGYQNLPNPAPPAVKKRSVGKIIGGCLGVVVVSCCCFSGLGGYVAYLEERSMSTPGDAISSVPLQIGSTQQVTVAHSGSGYAFAQIWADIEAQQTGPEEITMRGEVTCASAFGRAGYAHSVDVMVWEQNRRVADFERSGDRVSAKVKIHDEYMHEGERPKSCTVSLRLENGVLTSGSLVLRNYQRPSDRFAN